MEDNYIWTDGIELALNDIRTKSLNTSEHHKNNYYYFKGYLKYFRIPTIVLSGMNSVFSVGLQPYISQGIISILCCSISLICGIIASVELFLALQNMMEKELISSKEFYILSCEIFKTLSIERQHRMINGKIYLDNINTKYCSLIEQGNLVDKENIVENLKYGVNEKILQQHIRPDENITPIKNKELTFVPQNEAIILLEKDNIQLTHPENTIKITPSTVENKETKKNNKVYEKIQIYENLDIQYEKV